MSAVCGSCGAGELQRGGVLVWELQFGGAAVWGSHDVGELQCG